MATEISHLFARISADTAGFEKGMKSSHTALASFSSALGTGLVAAAALGVAAIAGVGAVMVKGIKSAAELEQNVANIGATMGLASADMKPFKDLITNLALDPNLKVNLDEASSAVATLAKMGVRGAEDMNAMARAAVLLANSTGGDLATASEVAMKAQKLWNISMEDTGRITNQTVGFLQNSTADLNDYRLGMSAAGGVASSMGVTLEDFNAALGVSIIKYGSAASAGDGMKMFLMGLVPHTQKAIDQMRDLGLFTGQTADENKDAQEEIKKMRDEMNAMNPAVEGYALKTLMLSGKIKALEESVVGSSNAFFTSEGVLKSQAEVADLLAEKVGSLGVEERTTALNTLFGQDGMRTAIALMEQRGVGVDAFKAKLADTNAEDAAAIRQDTLTAKWELFSDTIAASVAVIGEAFLPAGRQVVEWLASMSAKYMPSVIEWFQKFAAWLTDALPKIEAFIEKLAGWAGAFLSWATGSGKALDTVSTGAESMWTKVAGVFGNLMAWVKENLPIWVAQLKEWGAVAGDWIIETGWPKLKENLATWWGNLVDWVKTNYPIWVTNLQEWGKAAGDWVMETGWPALQANLSKWGAQLWQWLKDQVPVMIKTLAEWAVQLGAWVIEGIAFLISNLADGVNAVSRWLRGTGQDGIKGGVDSWIETMWTWVMTELWPKLEPALWALSDAILKIIGSMGILIFDAVMAIARGVVNVFIKRTEEEWAMFSTWWTNTWTDFVGLVGDIWGIATEWASDIIDGFKQGITDAWTGFKTWWSDLWQGILDIPKLIFGTHSPSTEFANVGANVMVGYQTGVGKELPSTMMQAAAVSQQLADATKQSLTLVKMTDVGTTAMAGVEQGISQGAIEAEKTALWASLSLYTQFGDGIKTGDMMKLSVTAMNAMQKGLDLGSPELFKAAERISNEVKYQIQNGADTNKMAALGMDAMQGLADGVTENSWRAKNAAADAAHAMIQRTKEVLDSHSPSKVFYDIGAGVIQGMANGLVDTMPIIARVLGDMRKTVTTVVAGMFDQLNAATAEFALRASFAGIQAGEMANVHNDLITQNDANSTGLGANWTWADLNARDTAMQQGTSINIANVNVGGSGNSAQDILQAVNFINSTYSYGY